MDRLPAKPAWSGAPEGANDEPMTVAFTGALPPPLERDRSFYVVVEGPTSQGKRFEVTEIPLIVGRSSKCDVTIPDERVSSRHLRLQATEERLIVEDLGSSNGTFLDGKRLTGPAEFGAHSTLQIGLNTLKLEIRSRKAVSRENDLAADLQKARSYIEALLPKPLATASEKSSWRLEPCAQLGGDAFGYHELDADRLAIYLLDVCGHGVGAAMLSVSAMNTIRRQSLPRVDFSDPAQVLSGLNEIFQMEDQDGMYFSIWYGVYQRSTRRLAYSSAGHPPALLLRGQDRQSVRLATKGLAIGVMPTIRVQRAEAEVAPGDRLYLFSDGAFEIVTATGQEWTFDEFEREVANNWAAVGAESARLWTRVSGLSRKPELDDDFSLIVMEFGSA